MPQNPWERLLNDACRATARAWAEIAPLYAAGAHVEHKPEGPVTEADRLADRLIQEELQALYPTDQYGYLTEETEDNLDRLDRDRVWIIDPIDGTSDFILKNGNFVIQIGLVERDPSGAWEAVLGVVYRPVGGDPALGEMYSAIRGRGGRVEFYNRNEPTGRTRELHVSSRSTIERMKAVISNSHRSARLDRFVESLPFHQVRPVGSIGIKLCLIARGDFDFYVNLARGKCREWDICGPGLILTEAGGTLTDLEGRPIRYNQRDVRNHGGMLASNGILHDRFTAEVERFEAENPPD
jgi:3'(2'), 5'-bisphosphate nucleotidase